MKRVLILVGLTLGLVLLGKGISLANPAEEKEINPPAREKAANQEESKIPGTHEVGAQSAIPGTHEVGAQSAIQNDNAPLGKYEFNVLGLGFRVVFALAVIIGIIYLIFRFFLKGKGFIGGASFISILGTAPLAPNRYLQLVELPGRILVLGIAEKEINLLTEIKDKEEIDLIKTQTSREESMNHPFSHHLRGFLGRFGVEEKKADPYEERLSFLMKEREKLSGLQVPRSS
ncbi:MAG: flagellar biosynthetic protein FliO [bacterium]|nr:flagellar biosynthetic protein FliO [bacterium]